MSDSAIARSGVRPARHPLRTWWLAATVATVCWSAVRAGLRLDGLLNTRGWGQVDRFFTAMFHPELSRDFLELTVREAGVTVGYALVGTALSLVIGMVGGVLLTERLWVRLDGRPASVRWVWRACRVAFAVPRSLHEVVFGLLLVNILGLDPLVAVLSIGIPFGAVTAKVFAEVFDEAPTQADRALRAAGAGPVTALVFGVVPSVTADLVSYAFYRFECALRAAAVLGIVGAGGLGFQLALSFQSLRYEQMWTLLWALIAISGLADAWSGAVRRRQSSVVSELFVEHRSQAVPPRDPLLRASVAVLIVATVVAAWLLDLRPTNLWSPRARRLGGDLVGDLWPPQIGRGGWSALVSDVADTVALAVLAMAIAWVMASGVAFVARRPTNDPARGPAGFVVRFVALGCRFILLIARAVPPPVWAFLALFVFLPGLWPGVVALAIYNLGVLGRLQAEVVENVDDGPGAALRATGATRTTVLAYATLPAVRGRFVSLGLYRWEVAIRETVIVGVVGAAGLGRRIAEQTARFDYDGILASILALVAITVAVDVVSASIRRSLR